ncbi:hypothetical protein U3516DRAFT_737264 [Neocallimastix sp. 'constans']
MIRIGIKGKEEGRDNIQDKEEILEENTTNTAKSKEKGNHNNTGILVKVSEWILFKHNNTSNDNSSASFFMNNVRTIEGKGGYNNTDTIVNTNKQNNTVSVQNNCSSKIKNKGYDCCSPECKATYTDEDGNWTIENGQWCGCENIKSDIANTECYSCCPKNCEIVFTDENVFK